MYLSLVFICRSISFLGDDDENELKEANEENEDPPPERAAPKTGNGTGIRNGRSKERKDSSNDSPVSHVFLLT